LVPGRPVRLLRRDRADGGRVRGLLRPGVRAGGGPAAQPGQEHPAAARVRARRTPRQRLGGHPPGRLAGGMNAMRYEKIVVGLDGSEVAAAALCWAARLAAATGAEIVVVHVVEPPAHDARPLHLPRAVLNEADWREALAAEVEGAWCER